MFLHDVDMIPLDVIIHQLIDQHTLFHILHRNHGEKRIIFDEYFGGVTLFPIKDYFMVNGYSNELLGLGL